MRVSRFVLLLLLSGCGPWRWDEVEDRSDGVFGDPSWIDRPALERSLQLAAEHMVTQQQSSGLFRYEYDVAAGRESGANNVVRQLGAYWGLGLLLSSPEAHLSPELRARVDASFERITRWIVSRRRVFDGAPGAAYLALGGQIETGAVALCALGLIERIKSGDRRQAPLLGELLAYLVAAERRGGGFAESYDPRRNRFSSRSNPYADGEVLLALAKNDHELGDARWREVLGRAAKGLRKKWYASERADDRKGFYQWGTMAFWHYAQLPVAGQRRFEDTILSYADWMVLEHQTLTRTKNTSYALEGLATAFRVARDRHDAVREKGLRFVIRKSHARLIAAQIGHPLARKNPFVQALPRARLSAERTRGGFLNGHEDPTLRIDVTQHAIHAMLLTLESGVVR